jgi:hypothetical protein
MPAVNGVSPTSAISLCEKGGFSAASHTIQKIVISDKLAFEYGTMETVRKNGKSTQGASLNVFLKEESGWKLLMNLPAAELARVITN